MSYRIKDETYLTASEAADEIGRATQTVYQHWKTWGWKPYRFGQTLLFKKSQVYTWLESQIIEEQPDRVTIKEWCLSNDASVRLHHALMQLSDRYTFIDEIMPNDILKCRNSGEFTYNEFKRLRAGK